MAIRGQEVELLGDGIGADSTTKGAFALNMLYRRNSWEVRRGFGQVTELDTTMGAIYLNQPDKVWGYRSHLGSYLMRSNFGHDQIISAFSSVVFTGDRRTSEGDAENASLSQFTPIYIVSIYDLTTGDRWEEPVYRHTADFGTGPSVFPMPKWKGNYESNWSLKWSLSGGAFNYFAPVSNTADRQQWIRATYPDTPFFFEELNDVLFFGNSDTGLLAYSPCTFKGWRRGVNQLSQRGRARQVDTVDERNWATPYSESSVVINAVATPGPFPDAYLYLDRTNFPKARGVASLGNRLVLFDDKNVYFSDEGFPTSFAAPNTLTLPSEDHITAAHEHMGNLIIFTRSETWLFMPGDGFITTAEARLIKLAEAVGCLGDSAITKAGDSLVWMGEKGAYTLGGKLNLSVISEAIEPFFNDYITNPLTNYYRYDGEIPTAAIPDQLPISVSVPAQIYCTYSPQLDVVLFSVPSAKAALCFGKGKWSMWSFETMVKWPEAGDEYVTQYIQSPWIMANETDIYMVASEPSSRPGEALLAGSPDDRTASRSYSILQYGRGGAVDRSVEAVEDYRQVVGRWKAHDEDASLGSSDHYLYVGKPVPVPPGMALGPSASQSLPADSIDGTVWVPFDLSLGYKDAGGSSVFNGPGALVITFTFDSTHWAPVKDGIGAIRFFLPPERQPTLVAWTVAETVAGTISIGFTGTPLGWSQAPNLNLNKHQRNRLLSIPFKPITTDTTVGMGINFTVKQVQDLRGPMDMRAFVWEESRLGAARHEDNNVAQAVDWAYKSAPAAAEGGVQVKGRGLYIDALSHGAAVAVQRLNENWPFGLLNILSAPDTKGWSSQVIDVVDSATGTPYPSSITNISTKNTLRTRYARNSTTDLTTNTFNNAADGPVYGTPGAAMGASNAELVADGEVGQLAVSDSVRGQSFTYMLWGSLQNKAERVVLGSVRAVMRVLGGKKRRGR